MNRIRLLTIVSCLFLTAEYAFAQAYKSNEHIALENSIQSGFLRIGFILIIIAFGFMAGWLFSNQGRRMKRLAKFIIALLTLIFIIFNSGILGWTVTIIASGMGFVSAFLYWRSKDVFGSNQSTFGSSRWATKYDLKAHNIYGDEGIQIGKAFNHNNQPETISYKGDGHLLTVAPTRSGKGTTQIIPNLLTYEGSMIVIDPKGENAMITAKRRKAMGQDVHIVDPWGIAQVDGIETSRFNPMDWLDITDIDITENAMLLADALVVGDNHQDSFWNEEAKALLQGIILYVATAKAEDGKRTLTRVRELLLQDADGLGDLFTKMAGSSHPIIKSTGSRSLQKEAKLLSNVLASAQAQTHFLDSARLTDNLQTSDFKFEDLKSKPMTIYLVLPADRLGAFGRWLRLLIQQAITVNARNIEVKPEKPVLFILDELAGLGRLSMIEQAFGLMAGFGLQLWAIVQDLNQLEHIYGAGWQSFVSNAGMINYFGSSDFKTAEYFSSLCGETTVWSLSTAIGQTVSSSMGGGSQSTSSGSSETNSSAASQRKLAFPDELMRMDSTKQLAFIDKMPPLRAQRVQWFENNDLKDLGVNLYANT